MRWLTYFILAYIALGLQIGAGPFMQFQGASPNLALLAVIFIAMNAPRDAALLGALCLGLMQDFLSGQPPGLYALSYGLVGMFIVSAHDVAYRGHFLTHISLALVGGFMTMGILFLHAWLRPSLGPATNHEVTVHAMHISPGVEFARVIYTAALAPVVLGILQSLRKKFGFQPIRRGQRQRF